MLVIMPSGSSPERIVRPAVSLRSKYKAPVSMLKGSACLELAPITLRAICGTISPIHPTSPLTEIAAAVPAVAVRRINRFSHFGDIPEEKAVLSSRDRISTTLPEARRLYPEAG